MHADGQKSPCEGTRYLILNSRLFYRAPGILFHPVISFINLNFPLDIALWFTEEHFNTILYIKEFSNKLYLLVFRSGMTTSSSGIRRSMAAWTLFTCHLNIFGCLILYFTTSEYNQCYYVLNGERWLSGMGQGNFSVIVKYGTSNYFH